MTTISLAGQTVTTALVNLRQGTPNTLAPVLRKLAAGTTVPIKGITTGESVQGNAQWFLTNDNAYVWSGGCAAPTLLSTPAPPSGGSSFDAALSIVAPKVSRATWEPLLIAAFAKYDINNDKRIAAAIGQFLVEAGSAFQEIIEDLTYSHAERIVEVFPDEFPTVASAEPYVRNKEALGNRAYANKLGNGNEASGDGYRFRGRGLLQLTGRDEYTEFGSTLEKTAEDAVAYCATSEGAAMSGCWYFNSRGCLPLADSWQINTITRKVNGSKMLGASQRQTYSDAMLKHLGGA